MSFLAEIANLQTERRKPAKALNSLSSRYILYIHIYILLQSSLRKMTRGSSQYRFRQDGQHCLTAAPMQPLTEGERRLMEDPGLKTCTMRHCSWELTKATRSASCLIANQRADLGGKQAELLKVRGGSFLTRRARAA